VFNKSLILIVVVVVGYGRVEIEITDGESAEFSRKKERKNAHREEDKRHFLGGEKRFVPVLVDELFGVVVRY